MLSDAGSAEEGGMSFSALAWAVRQKLPSTQKLVLIMLAERHNKDTGRCDPSHDLLAEDCGLTRRSVMEQIRRLAEAGYIRVLHRAKDNAKLSNLYLLNLHFGAQEEVKTPLDDPHVVSAKTVGGSEPGSHKPGIEPKKQKQKIKISAQARLPDNLDFSTWPSRPSEQVLIDWLHLRRKRGADVTPTVMKSFGKELHKAAAMGFTVDDCLTKCCARNWQGFEAWWLEKGTGPPERGANPNRTASHPGGTHATPQPRESLVDRAARKLEKIGVLHQ